MKTMKAVRLFEFGGPEKLVYGDYPVPDVGPTDVGEVHEFYGKSTGHHGGIQGRRVFPMPMQLGRDAAGEVVAVGARGATRLPGGPGAGVTKPRKPPSLPSNPGRGHLSRGGGRSRPPTFRGRSPVVVRPGN